MGITGGRKEKTVLVWSQGQKRLNGRSAQATGCPFGEGGVLHGPHSKFLAANAAGGLQAEWQ